ncbi:transcription initiation factor TFIID subunit 8-like isoform X2 [Symsagittifera roscoffensis]|uniref:transcription initiation factor TFIID subunit 8-like isoform X2 n=1 Tax=Symsagittifera roscoffensis TaxID=84072 RepID=UPI00307C3FDE
MCAISGEQFDKSLISACACILRSLDVNSVTPKFIEALASILKMFLIETASNTRRYAEHANRQSLLPDDIIAALVSIGFNVSALPQYYQQTQQKCLLTGSKMPTVSNPELEARQPDPKRLKIGNQIEKPPFIPSYMLPLPESYTFAETKTFARINDNYRISREHYATQSRTSDSSLIAIHLKHFASSAASVTGYAKTQTLFHSDQNQFQLLSADETTPLQSFHAILETSEAPVLPDRRRKQKLPLRNPTRHLTTEQRGPLCPISRLTAELES